MFIKTIFVTLAIAGFSLPLGATTILDTGPGFAYTSRPANDGLGQGVSVATNTTLSAFGFDFFMPEGGTALFMIWDETNSSLLFSETAQFEAQSEALFRFTNTLNAFSLIAGHNYYFGLIGNEEISVGYFYPTVELTQHGISLLTDGNSNYSDFSAPFALDTGGASLGLQLMGNQALLSEAPEGSTWVTLMSGLALIVLSRRRTAAGRE